MSPRLEGGIAVLDFGGQYSHLICRKVRSLGVYAALLPYETSAAELEKLKVAGVILSGGPASVYAEGAPHPDPAVLDGRLPVLGICYGYQLLVEARGGEVARSKRREYGRSGLRVTGGGGGLFKGVAGPLTCWMSHGDSPVRLPAGLKPVAASDNSPYAAAESADGRLFGVQFHPEVAHTERGGEILANFVLGVCNAEKNWEMAGFVEDAVARLSSLEGRVLCAVSGGVDSSVTAALLSKAMRDRLQCVFIETGLLRKGEAETVRGLLAGELKVPVDFVDASEKFLRALKGVEDPEAKRKVVGELFARVFEEYAREKGPFRYLAQGTLYPDVIESGRTGAPASVIKSHHNVGALPADLSLEVVEPLRDLYKDEVRETGRLLGLPRTVLSRHPFPGPGLAVRVVGEATAEKLRISREAGAIVEEVLKEEGLYDEVWQAFAYVGDDMVTGLQGDERLLGHQVIVKVVQSSDAMTADWYRIPEQVLERISARITNEVDGVVAVAYSATSKPPATIEPQ